MKVHDYENGKVVGEHYEMIEVEEETQPNPMLLKFLAEKKLTEKFGEEKSEESGKFRGVVDNLSDEQAQEIIDLGN